MYSTCYLNNENFFVTIKMLLELQVQCLNFVLRFTETWKGACLHPYFVSWLPSSELVTSYARHLEKKHDMILGMLFERGTYKKLYSYHHLINGFAVHTTPEQVTICTLESFSLVKFLYN